MPEIAATILRKIERAGFFLADVTFVGDSPKGKLLPNPNVMLELGYAARAIGWERLICVMNEAFGSRDLQIFDIRHRRYPIAYRLDERADHAAARIELITEIREAVRALMWSEHLGAADAVARLDSQCMLFLRIHAATDVIVPRPTNVVTWGAPPGELDTPAYQHAIVRLLDLGLLRCDIEQATGEPRYSWTYLGALVLQRLGLRTT